MSHSDLWQTIAPENVHDLKICKQCLCLVFDRETIKEFHEAWHRQIASMSAGA